MRTFLLAIALLSSASVAAAQSHSQTPQTSGHYLFAWTGDVNLKGKDFLAVIDADPASPSYGQLITTVVTDQQTVRIHHTEYVMPDTGMLFANDHDAGRTFIFDVRDPLHPKIVASFTDMAGYMHPHSYVRLPNGHVLATFQHAHHDHGLGSYAVTGGLVEIDDSGKAIRSASNADAAFPDAQLTPYGLVVLPEIDRIVSTNSSMHVLDGVFRGVTYQVWRLSDLKLLKTEYLDVGENRYAHISPEEPRRGPGWFGLHPDAGLRHRARHRHRFRNAAFEAGLHVSRRLVWRSDDCEPLSGAECPGHSRSHCRRHQQSVPAERGLAAGPRRHVPPALDGMGRENWAAGGHRLGAALISGEVRHLNPRSCDGRCVSRCGWQARLQFSRSSMATRMDGLRLAAWRSIFEVIPSAWSEGSNLSISHRALPRSYGKVGRGCLGRCCNIAVTLITDRF